MSVYLECDQCRKRLKIPENVVGQKIKCPTCGAVFKATSDKIQATKPSSEPATVLAADDDELVTPKKKAAIFDEDDDEPRPKKKAEVLDDDDDEPVPVKAKRRSRDEDEDEEEAPKRRRTAWYVLLPLFILSLSGIGIAFLWVIGFTWLIGQSWNPIDVKADAKIPFDTKTIIGIAVAGAVTLLCLIFSLIPIRSWLRFVLVLFFLVLGYGGSLAVVHWWKDMPF